MTAFEISAPDYQKAARALKNADRTIRLEYSRALRAIAKPLAQSVLEDGAARLPQSGGLAGRVAGAKVSVSATQMRAVASLKTAEGYDLRAIERGRLRHPTYGHEPWKEQTIPSRVFGEAFDQRAPAARAAMMAAGEHALRRIVLEGS